MDYSLNLNGCYATNLTRLLSITAKINMTAMSTFLPSASISLGLPDEFSALDARMALDVKDY
jgi:hypothetical protein